jgi:hypothetical protein
MGNTHHTREKREAERRGRSLSASALCSLLSRSLMLQYAQKHFFQIFKARTGALCALTLALALATPQKAQSPSRPVDCPCEIDESATPTPQPSATASPPPPTGTHTPQVHKIIPLELLLHLSARVALHDVAGPNIFEVQADTALVPVFNFRDLVLIVLQRRAGVLLVHLLAAPQDPIR